MLMILPRPCGIMTRAAAWQAKNTLLNDALIVLSNSSSVTSSAGRGPRPPGVVHEDVDASERLLRRVDHRADVVDLGDVGELDERSAAQLLDLGLDLLDLVVPPFGMLGEHQVRAGLREAERDGAADPLRGAGDDGDLVLQAESSNSRANSPLSPPGSIRSLDQISAAPVWCRRCRGRRR